MTCLEVADFLLDHVEGTLPPQVGEAFGRHLLECPTCVAYVENYRSAVRLGRLASARDGGEPALPEELVRAILDSLRAAG